jgi:hypothetical protein
MCRQPCKNHTGETTCINGQFSAPQNEFGDLPTHIATLGGKMTFCAKKLRESSSSTEYSILTKCVNRMRRKPCRTHTGETTCINCQFSAPQIEFGDLASHIATLGGRIPFCADKLRESCPSAEY